TYGTGAVMGVPAHDERDFAFAEKYGLDVRVVIAPPDWDGSDLTAAYIEPGVAVNSGQFDGLPNDEVKSAVADYLDANGWGSRRVTARLRDWLIWRQRYWGAPVPMIHCPRCGIVPVSEDQLPVELPYDVEFRPAGESPLALAQDFVNTICPQCLGEARGDTE